MKEAVVFEFTVLKKNQKKVLKLVDSNKDLFERVIYSKKDVLTENR